MVQVKKSIGHLVIKTLLQLIQKEKLLLKKVGTATITAKIGSTKYKSKITVKEKAPSITTGQANALKSAKSYLELMAFSKEGLKSQLEYEQYSSSEISYVINNCIANWNEQALKCANSYLGLMGFSEKSLRSQLEFEKFTTSEIDYAIKNCKADWYKEAVESAISYLEISSFSRSELFNQLEFEGFTNDQIEYALNEVGY